jgi:phage terminase small subunit
MPSYKRDPGVKIENPDPETLGAAMLECGQQQQRFVIAYSMCGDATAAARAAGYSDAGEGCKVRGCELLRHPKVIAALKEWTAGALNGRGAFVAIAALVDIAGDASHADRLKAADSILDRTGFSRQTTHQVSIEHTDVGNTDDLVEALEKFAAKRRLAKQAVKELPVIEGSIVQAEDAA